MKVIAVIIITLFLYLFFRLVWIKHILDNPIIFRGIHTPSYVVSDHQRLSIVSDELKEYMNGELNTLSLFHSYCLSHGMKYTLIAGSLMSALKIGTYFPWDDDIDLLLREGDWCKIEDLWNNGVNYRDIERDKRWEAKDILIGGEEMIMLRNITNHSWVKLTKEIRDDLPDIGGIDIGYTFTEDGRTYESINPPKEAPKIFNTKIISFGGVETMITDINEARSYLDRVYNSDWEEDIHPDYRSNIFSILIKKIL